MPKERSISQEDESRWNILQRRLQEIRTVQAVGLMRSCGIEPIVIKGVAAARFFPPEQVRLAIDVDLAVAGADFEKAREIATSPGANGLAIDLHCELRHLDRAPWTDLTDNSELVPLEKSTVRVLRPEDHLRVMCVHWLTDGGVQKDRLWDIYYAVANRPGTFDWDRFLDTTGARRRRWFVCTLGLVHRYLGLPLDGTPIKEEALDLPSWLTGTVEREWASETKPWPLEASLNDPKRLAAQVKRRLRPNAIWATVQMEGSFDAPTRIHYQIVNFLSRILPSSRRVAATLRQSSE